MMMIFEGKVNKVEAAKILEISPKTLSNWIYQDKGPRHFVYGHKLYFDIRDLEQFKKALIQVREHGSKVG